MKKALWVILGLCLVFALSCASGGGTQAATPTADPNAPVPGGTLNNIQFTLNWNPPGSNFQAEIRNPEILNGYRLRGGDSFTLKVRYTTSRDVPNGIGVGFADMNPWAPLSWRQPGGTEIPQNNNTGAEFPASRAGVPVEAEVTINLRTSASSAAPRANTFILAALGAQSAGPIIIDFQEFILTKN